MSPCDENYYIHNFYNATDNSHDRLNFDPDNMDKIFQIFDAAEKASLD